MNTETTKVAQYFNMVAITPSTSTPTHEILKILQRELNDNSMSVPSDATHNGHLTIIMTPVEYVIKDSEGFQPLTNPVTGPEKVSGMTAGRGRGVERDH